MFCSQKVKLVEWELMSKIKMLPLSLLLALGQMCWGGYEEAVESGVPGDSIIDFYYFPVAATIDTSIGPVSQPGGTMLVDTDGVDLVVMSIGGPDVSVSGCSLCDGGNLPGMDATGDASTWTVGRSAGRTEWIRTNPLIGTGFRGVVGEAFVDGDDNLLSWPSDVLPAVDFPEPSTGIANYGLGLSDADFSRGFDDGFGGFWGITYVREEPGVFLTNVTVVPEPGGHVAFVLLLVTCSLRIRNE